MAQLVAFDAWGSNCAVGGPTLIAMDDIDPFALSDEPADGDDDAAPGAADEPSWWDLLATDGGGDEPDVDTGGVLVVGGGLDAVPPRARPGGPGPEVDVAAEPLVTVTALLGPGGDVGGGRGKGRARGRGGRRGRPPSYVAHLRADREAEEAAQGPSPPIGVVDSGALVPLPTVPEVVDWPVVPFQVADGGIMDVLPNLGIACVDGYMVVPRLAQTVRERVVALRNSPEPVDADKVDQIKEFLAETHSVTLSALSARRNLHSGRYRENISRFWMVWWLWMLAKRQEVEEAITTSLGQFGAVIHLYEEMRYDETPLHLRVKEMFKAWWREGGDSADQAAGALAVTGTAVVPLGFDVQSTTGTKQILQTAQTFAFLLELANGELLSVISDYPSPLVLLESERAPVMTQAMMRNVGTSRFCTRIKNKSRLVTADGHASNRKCEELLESVRTGWLFLFLLCELHCIAIAYEEAFFFP